MCLERGGCVFTCCHQYFGFAVLADKRHLLRVQSHVNRDDGGTSTEASEERLEHSRPVPLHKYHAVSWTYTKGLQSPGQLTNPLVQLSIGELLLTMLDCQSVTLEPAGLRQKGSDVHTTPRFRKLECTRDSSPVPISIII